MRDTPQKVVPPFPPIDGIRLAKDTCFTDEPSIVIRSTVDRPSPVIMDRATVKSR